MASCELQPTIDLSEPSSCSTIAEPVEPAKLYDRSFVLAFLSQTVFVIANTLMAHYGRWIEFLGGNLQQVGWITGVCVATSIVMRPMMALLINRLGAKTTWWMGYLIFSLSASANCFLPDLNFAIYFIRSCNVLGAAIVFASSLTYISQVAPEERRTEAIGILGVGGFFGMLVGPYLGDLLLGDGTRERSGFLTLFVVAAAANILPGIMLYFVKAPARPPSGHSLRLSQFVRVARAYWPGRILLVDFVFGVCMSVPFAFLVNFVDDLKLHFAGWSEVGFFFICYASVGIIFRVGLRRLPEQIGPQNVLLIGLCVMALGMFSFSLVGPQRVSFLAIPAVLAGLGHSLMFHTMTSLTIQSFPQEYRGTGSALALMTLDLGTLLGAPVLGWIGAEFGYSMLFNTIAFALIATFVFCLKKI